jgi:hypothetical protein
VSSPTGGEFIDACAGPTVPFQVLHEPLEFLRETRPFRADGSSGFTLTCIIMV